MRGALAVALGLTALYWLTSSTLPGLGPALSYPATLAARWLDATVPLIPQKGPPLPAVGLNSPSTVQGVINAATNNGVTNS